MGVKNKQRRAAKKKRAQQRPDGGRRRHEEPFLSEVSPFVARNVVVGALRDISSDAAAAAGHAERFLRPDGLLPPHLARAALEELLEELIAAVVQQGWRPTDVAEIVGRQLSRSAVPALVPLLATEVGRHTIVAPAWRNDLTSLGRGQRLDLTLVAGLQAALELAACLATLGPIGVLIPPPGTAAASGASTSTGDPKLLAKVRALLAKAESTQYDEEADLLSAKAQELISRHALDRVLAESAGQAPAAEPTARRIWIDAPYVFGKAMLVHAVAEANRCRSVMTEALGFCTVFGQEEDLHAVDLLVTSLLLQAGTAMRRCGRQTDSAGTSRTRSFRQSFLLSYASRIGERLREATAQAADSTGRAGELVPVLRTRAEHVDRACEAMFPQLVSRRAGINNARGWAAGRAAADQAQLVTDKEISQAS
ncbi:MAG: hypothetical protein JWM62_2835 [Frankiales bacterium]|nr:hypothetical protein [Frankiales bacterium]